MSTTLKEKVNQLVGSKELAIYNNAMSYVGDTAWVEKALESGFSIDKLAEYIVTESEQDEKRLFRSALRRIAEYCFSRIDGVHFVAEDNYYVDDDVYTLEHCDVLTNAITNAIQEANEYA